MSDETKSVTPGWKTSEFWLHIAMAVAGMVYQALSQSTDPTVIVSLQAASAVYTAARTFTKR